MKSTIILKNSSEFNDFTKLSVESFMAFHIYPLLHFSCYTKKASGEIKKFPINFILRPENTFMGITFMGLINGGRRRQRRTFLEHLLQQ